MDAILDPDLVMSDEPDAVERLQPSPASALLIHCDHGGNRVPAKLQNLGLAGDVLDRHVGWDIGAAAVTRQLSAHLIATAVIARYSRLVIDLNRALGDADAIPMTSDGIAIPGNAALTAAQHTSRADALFWPYHRAIDEELAHIKTRGKVPIVLSIHSFTPALMRADVAQARPWHCGVMFSSDSRFGDHLIAALRGVPGMVVGVNEPYSGISHGYCLKAHGLAQGLPHAQIEIRQDLICTPPGQKWWGHLLSRLIEPILSQSDLAAICHY